MTATLRRDPVLARTRAASEQQIHEIVTAPAREY
jgi:hypothetical protein